MYVIKCFGVDSNSNVGEYIIFWSDSVSRGQALVLMNRDELQGEKQKLECRLLGLGMPVCFVIKCWHVQKHCKNDSVRVSNVTSLGLPL